MHILFRLSKNSNNFDRKYNLSSKTLITYLISSSMLLNSIKICYYDYI